MSENEQVPAFTKDELATIANSSPQVQTAVADLLSQNLPPHELITGVRHVLEEHGKAPEAALDPVGANSQTAMATGQGLSNVLALNETAHEQGRSTIDKGDIERHKIYVERLVQGMLAKGASREEIEQAVGQVSNAPELAAVGQEVANQQIEAQKFNLFAGAGGQDNGASYALMGGILTAAAGAGGVAVSEAEAKTGPFPFIDMGSTTAALAYNPPPLPNVPDVRVPSPNRGTGVA